MRVAARVAAAPAARGRGARAPRRRVASAVSPARGGGAGAALRRGGGGGGGGGGALAETLVLTSVPLAWGTWAVVNVLMLNVFVAAGVPPPPPPAINAGIQAASLAALTAVCAARAVRTAGGRGASLPAPSALPGAFTLRGGAELGAWLFLGSSLQLYALTLTTASRVAFLVQATTVIVPMLEAALCRRAVSGRTWFACAMATSGIALLSFGGGGAPASALPPGHALGDALALTSAAFFAMHVVRLQGFAAACVPLELAWVKAATQAALTLALVLAGVAFGIFEVVPTLDGLAVAGPHTIAAVCALVAWNGVVPSAYTVWAQGFAQRAISAPRANLFYSAQPLAAAALAAAFLGESLGAHGAAGGALIVGACVIGGGADTDAEGRGSR